MASLLLYVMKAKPLGEPSSLMGSLRETISPHSAKSLVNDSSVTENGRFLTNTVFSSPPDFPFFPLPLAEGSPPSMRTFFAQRQSLQRVGVSAKPLSHLNCWSSAVSTQSSEQSRHLYVLSFHSSSSAAAGFATSTFSALGFASCSFSLGCGAASSSSSASAAAAAAFFASAASCLARMMAAVSSLFLIVEFCLAPALRLAARSRSLSR
mmetsp:Transcript_55532/g.107103  ORF Transcript_55532/g.107103 Transcript_55532/m.107103 type:complete len:209 (+) Transcript_55532:502-1128(+)